MESKDLFLTLIIFIIFIGLYLFNVVSVGMNNIESNWPLYRCNPIVMPFAGLFNHDALSNFTYCIQNIQTGHMDDLLQPLNYSQTLLGAVANDLIEATQAVREFFNKIRTFIESIIHAIMGVFLNILISVQRIIITVLDIFAKLVGVVAALGGIINGSNKFSLSVWNGPPGQTLRAVGSVCFDENTLIQKNDKTIIKMKDLNLGDILKNGSIVQAKMFISNIYNNTHIDQLYSIPFGEDKKDIIVSGSHLIFNKDSMSFIKVQDYDKAIPCAYNLDNLFCLITSDHTIPLGNYIFHDWEDNNGSITKNIY